MARAGTIAAVVGSLLLLLCCASASAAIRYAGPGGTATGACDDPQDPCSIFTAASATVPDVEVGDEVVLLPGQYSDTAGDLGPNGNVVLKIGIDLHGEFGQPRPVITSSKPFGVLTMVENDGVSHLEIDSATARVNIDVAGGVVEGLISRSSATGGVACGQSRGLLRRSACLSSGIGGSAIGVDLVAGPRNVKLRNVTAVATGRSSSGLNYRVSASPEFIVDAVNVIARGAAQDVLAQGRAFGSGSAANVKINLSHSDYGTTLTEVDPGGSAEISPTGPGTTNIEAAPQLAADGYHQLPTSPTVDAGVVDPLIGEFDIDGQELLPTETPDIGADELGPETSTALSCLPASLVLGEGAATCTATVEDVVAVGEPTGSVEFASGGEGEFSATACQLATLDGITSCQVTYTPIAKGEKALTATYGGDFTHGLSVDTTQLPVAGHQTRTGVTCASQSLSVGSLATCTATVTDASAGPIAPSGTVGFASNGAGAFSGAGTCALAASGGGASCQLTYTPSAVGGGRHEITATYSGDPGHEGSEGGAGLAVLGTATPPAAPNAPNTTIAKKPRRKTAQSQATFTFSSNQAGASFQCKLDRKPFRSCRSPFKARVKRGRHSFAVRAVSPQGLTDPTPASFRWTVG